MLLGVIGSEEDGNVVYLPSVEESKQRPGSHNYSFLIAVLRDCCHCALQTAYGSLFCLDPPKAFSFTDRINFRYSFTPYVHSNTFNSNRYTPAYMAMSGDDCFLIVFSRHFALGEESM